MARGSFRIGQVVAGLAGSVLLIAACGGGSSSTERQRNTALCYVDQAEKDAAVLAAQDAFDASFGESSEQGDTTVPADTTVPETTIPDTTEPVEPEVTPDTNPEASGGYRRPALRHVESTPPTDPTDSTTPQVPPVMTDEQLALQMAMQAAEEQPICESSDTPAVDASTEVNCTGTFVGVLNGQDAPSGTNDCPGPFELITTNYTNWVLYIATGTWDDPEDVVAQGEVDLSEMTPENPISFDISYMSQEEQTESTDPSQLPCSATFTTTGVSWECTDGTIFNAGFEEESNPGVYPSYECVSSGEFVVPENSRFWFNFHLVNGDQTFFDGYNTDRVFNEPYYFPVPLDVRGVCTPVEQFDWEGLEFHGELDGDSSRVVMIVGEDPVSVRFIGDHEFYIESEDGFIDVPSIEVAEGINEVVLEEMLETGEYILEIDLDEETQLAWDANVEVIDTPIDFPATAYSYVLPGSEQRYMFTLTEPTPVTLTATAGETCGPWEDDNSENGFADPELELLANGDEIIFDDNDGRGAGNCSASLISVILDPGTFEVVAYEDDGEGGPVTVGSSVELTETNLEWNLATQTVTPDESFEIVVPAGGSWFRAEANTYQTNVWTYAGLDGNSEDLTSSVGCFNPDDDLSTNDDNCIDPFIGLIDQAESGEYFEFMTDDDDNGANYTEAIVDGHLVATETNVFGSLIERFLVEGTYTLVSMSCCGPGNEPTGSYELKFGFGSVTAVEAPLVTVTPVETPPNVEVPAQAKMSDNVVSLEPGAVVALSPDVETMVCDSGCVESLFVESGLADGSIEISIGEDFVTVYKGQYKAVIPVSKNSDKISAKATSADGTKVVELNSKVVHLPTAVQAAIDAKQSVAGSTTTTTLSADDAGSASKLPYAVAVAVLVVALAAFGARRRKKTA